jgi:hypothetical protein
VCESVHVPHSINPDSIRIVPMTLEHAEDITGWRYQAPYDVYDMTGVSPDELLDPGGWLLLGRGSRHPGRLSLLRARWAGARMGLRRVRTRHRRWDAARAHGAGTWPGGHLGRARVRPGPVRAPGVQSHHRVVQHQSAARCASPGFRAGRNVQRDSRRPELPCPRPDGTSEARGCCAAFLTASAAKTSNEVIDLDPPRRSPRAQIDHFSSGEFLAACVGGAGGLEEGRPQAVLLERAHGGCCGAAG